MTSSTQHDLSRAWLSFYYYSTNYVGTCWVCQNCIQEKPQNNNNMVVHKLYNEIAYIFCLTRGVKLLA